MEKTNVFDKELPKWPALVVKGKPVTKDQAKEIIVRTSGFYFGCNDREWESIINELIFGIRATSNEFDKLLKEKHGIDEKDFNKFWEIKESYYEKYSPIENLYYLSNSRISSSWIGGPYGWCSWNGKIGCSNYNIGKYPSVTGVYNEWVRIAEAFPYLDLKCQLMDSEAGENEEPKPVVEFEIKNGKVEAYEPTGILDYPVFGSEDISFRFSNPYAERGCDQETLKDAFEYTEAIFSTKNKIKENQFWESVKEN
jgi:hypothetical protein